MPHIMYHEIIDASKNNPHDKLAFHLNNLDGTEPDDVSALRFLISEMFTVEVEPTFLNDPTCYRKRADRIAWALGIQFTDIAIVYNDPITIAFLAVALSKILDEYNNPTTSAIYSELSPHDKLNADSTELWRAFGLSGDDDVDYASMASNALHAAYFAIMTR
mgnify:FL=1